MNVRAIRVGCVALSLSALTTVSRSGFADQLALPEAAEAAASPASRYANMEGDQVLEELRRRNIDFEQVAEAKGVRTPIRLLGKLHGVWVHSSLPAEQRRSTPFEILDGRLALALDDFAEVLSNHEVTELIHFTMYRPNDDVGEGTTSVQTRHPGGMAIDVGALRKKGGALLSVQAQWSPSIGATTCGEGARKLASRRGRELMSILCEAKDLRLFHCMLTPHFNRAHHDHLHLEDQTRNEVVSRAVRPGLHS